MIIRLIFIEDSANRGEWQSEIQTGNMGREKRGYVQ